MGSASTRWLLPAWLRVQGGTPNGWSSRCNGTLTHDRDPDGWVVQIPCESVLMAASNAVTRMALRGMLCTVSLDQVIETMHQTGRICRTVTGNRWAAQPLTW